MEKRKKTLKISLKTAILIFILLISIAIILIIKNIKLHSKDITSKENLTFRTEKLEGDFNGDGNQETLKLEIKYWYTEVPENMADDTGLRYETLLFLDNKIINADYFIEPHDTIEIIDYNNDGSDEIKIIHKILPPGGGGFLNSIYKINNNNIELLLTDTIRELDDNYNIIKEEYYKSSYLN